MKRPRAIRATSPSDPAIADDNLVAWAAKRADWSRDALRRHAISTAFALSVADKAEVIKRVRYAAEIDTEEVPVYEPLTTDHVKDTGQLEPRTLLCSLGPVRHLNRLAPDQQMHFATNGLTLVLGDNGTGKSGYARVAKKMCRSLSKDDLLGNVFEPGAKVPAEILVRYQVDGAPVTDVTWIDDTPTPPPLASMSFFDSQNARLYVDRENRINYLPPDILLLERHGAHCTEMDETFRAELGEIQKRVKIPLPSGYNVGGAVALLLARLDPNKKDLPTTDEIEALAKANDNDAVELQRLELLLAHDPAELAARCRRAKVALERSAAQISAAATALSPAQVTALETLQDEALATAQASALAASARFASEPLKDVGSEPWRLMYDYAKAFAEGIGATSSKLPDQLGDLCLLCQEPLSETGAARVKAFNDFVAGEATKAADAAREARNLAIEALALQLPTKAQESLALAEFSGLSDLRKVLVVEIADYCEAAAQRRDALLKACTKEDFASIPALKADLSEKMALDIAALEEEANTYDKAVNDDSARTEERALLAQLRDRKKLSDDLETVLARLEDLTRIGKLKKCASFVETGSISRQITALRRSLVMKGLRQDILAEIGALELSHIPFQISDHSSEGQSLFGVGLMAVRDVPNNKVLSEGEQRALALACFLAEATATGKKHGLILDDPVSSLDHKRIRRVAVRIAAEAGSGRQIIVFTHNILFFNELVDAAARMNPQVPVLTNFISKTTSAGFGLVSDKNEPWSLMAVTKRIANLSDRLNGYASTRDFDTEEWRKIAKDFYSDLRETWERLVEEVLLAKTVERFSSDVRTQSLKGVVVNDDDYKTVFDAMKRVSERSGHDMAAGRSVPTPTTSDMKADLDKIIAFRTMADKRRKETSQVREALEKPPKATVA